MGCCFSKSPQCNIDCIAAREIPRLLGYPKIYSIEKYEKYFRSNKDIWTEMFIEIKEYRCRAQIVTVFINNKNIQ